LRTSIRTWILVVALAAGVAILAKMPNKNHSNPPVGYYWFGGDYNADLSVEGKGAEPPINVHVADPNGGNWEVTKEFASNPHRALENEISWDYSYSGSPGQITISLAFQAQKDSRGVEGTSVNWVDCITPHWHGHPIPSNVDLEGAPVTSASPTPRPELLQYVVPLRLRLYNASISCSQRGSRQVVWYIGTAAATAGDTHLGVKIATLGSTAGTSNVFDCPSRTASEDTFGALNGWPTLVTLGTQTYAGANNLPLGQANNFPPGSGSVEMKLTSIGICVIAPADVTITSASGHDYSCPTK